MQSSSIYQPPCGICRKCGAFNKSIAVPANYKFGHVSFMGVESTAHYEQPWFHINDKAKTRAPVFAQRVSPMLVMSGKRNLLGWDPECHQSKARARQKTPADFDLQPFTFKACPEPSKIVQLLPQFFHCAATAFPINIDVPDLPQRSPGDRVNRPDVPLAPRNMPRVPANRRL